MNKTSVRRAALSCALLASTAYLALAASPSLAQTSPVQPAHRAIDGNGIDLVNGGFFLDFVEGSIGSGDGELALRRRNAGLSQWDNIFLERSMSGSSATVWVNLGLESEKFTGTMTSLSSTQASGGSLAGNGGGYVYTARDGTTISFFDPSQHQWNGSSNLCFNDPAQTSCRLLPDQITSPDGKTVSLEWQLAPRCSTVFNPDGSLDCQYFWRLGRVENSFGYRIDFTYAAADTGGALGSTPAPAWSQRTRADFLNTAVSTTVSQANVTYSYPSAGVTDVTDMGGRIWRFTANGSGAITGIRRPGAAANTTAITYGSGTTTVVSEGVTTTYGRSVSGSLATTTITNALNQTTTVVADTSLGRVKSVTDPLNRTTTLGYDSFGRLTDATQPEGNRVHHVYDDRGNIQQTDYHPKAGSGLATISTYASFDSDCVNPATCNQPNSITDARGKVTEYSYDPVHGGLLMATGPAPTTGANRPQTRFRYDLVNGEYRLTGTSVCQTLTGSLSGNPAACAGTADEVVTTFGYDANGNVTSQTVAAGNGSPSAASAMTYDALGNLLTVDGPLAGSADTTRYRYNAARQITGVISPDPDGAGAMPNRAMRYSYTNGLLTKVEQGTVPGQLDATWGSFSPRQAIETRYDANARPFSQALTSGGAIYQLTQASYDALGRLDCSTQRMNPGLFSSMADPSTNPTPVCSLGTPGTGTNDFGPDRITRTAYDELGRVKTITSGLGTAEQSNDLNLTFTSNGQVETLLDAEGNKTTFGYDGFDRPKTTCYPLPTKGAGASSATDCEQVVSYDANGNPTLLQNRAGEQIGLDYDDLNRLRFKNLPGAEPDVTYTYDLLGRMTGASSSAGALTFTYDALGRLIDQVQPLGTVHSDYDAAGRRTGISYPGGYSLTQDYYVTGEISHVIENGNPSVTLGTYEYDDLGRRSKLISGNGVVTSYGYDAVSRLLSLDHNLAGSAYDVTLGYAYNPAGQISRNTRSNDLYATAVPASGTLSTPANGLNQISGFGYDARGNLTSDGGSGYDYTSENVMKSAGSVTMEHDPLMRLSKVVNGANTSRYLYDGTRVIADYTGSGVLGQRYAFGPGADEPLSGLSGTFRYWFHADERGSMVTVSNASAGPSNPASGYARYEEYGRQQTPNAGLFQYTGQKAVSGTTLLDYKARVYNPSLGRFMQKDPLAAVAIRPYAYAGDDPINLVDPSGLLDCPAGMRSGIPTGSHIEQCLDPATGWLSAGLSPGSPLSYGGGWGMSSGMYQQGQSGSTTSTGDEIVVTLGISGVLWFSAPQFWVQNIYRDREGYMFEGRGVVSTAMIAKDKTFSISGGRRLKIYTYGAKFLATREPPAFSPFGEFVIMEKMCESCVSINNITVPLISMVPQVHYYTLDPRTQLISIRATDNTPSGVGYTIWSKE